MTETQIQDPIERGAYLAVRERLAAGGSGSAVVVNMTISSDQAPGDLAGRVASEIVALGPTTAPPTKVKPIAAKSPRVRRTTRAKKVTPQAAAPVVAKPAAAAKPRRATKSGEKRPPEAIKALTERLGAHIVAHPGEGIEAIAKQLGVETAELTLPIRKLRASKAISSTGKKRATRYFGPKAKTPKHANGIAHAAAPSPAAAPA